MKVHCEGCAGCCIDWRPLSPIDLDHERRDEWEPIDDQYNFVPLTRDDVEAFSNAGLTDALTPRLWRDRSADVSIDDAPIACLDGKPVFFLGMRKPLQPVDPFGNPRTWLPACVFLDPATLQCRIHEADHYPTECQEYPTHNLFLESETECERVERAGGGKRLLDRSLSGAPEGLVLGPQTIGFKVFVHPEPDRITALIDRLESNSLTATDRASFVAAVLASSPGSTDHEMARYRSVIESVKDASSWVSDLLAHWQHHDESLGDPVTQPLNDLLYRSDDLPKTPGW